MRFSRRSILGSMDRPAPFPGRAQICLGTALFGFRKTQHSQRRHTCAAGKLYL